MKKANNILIIGSIKKAVDAIASILAAINENLFIATTLDETLKLIESREFALIIFDKSLNQQERINFAKTIRQNKNSKSTQIILLCEDIIDEDFILSINDIEAIDILPAPISPERLRTRVSAYLEIYSNQKELKEILKSTPEQNKALILHTDPILVSNLQKHIETEGVIALWANSEKAAIELLNKYEFSLILLDTSVPNLDAFKLCQTIKTQEKHQHAQVVMLTNLENYKRDSSNAYETGASDVILMPAPIELLKTKILLYVSHAKDLKLLAENLKEIQRLNEELIHSRGELKLLNLTLQDRINEKTSLLQKAADELRKQNEQLMLSEERFRLIIEGSDIGVFLTDSQENITFTNSRLRQMTLLSETEIDNKNPSELFGDNNRIIFKEILSNREKDKFTYKILEYKRKDGAVLWFNITLSSIYDKNENFYGHCGILTDITESKLYQDKIQQQAEVLDKASDAIFLIGIDGKIGYYNKKAETLTGIPLSDAAGKHFCEITLAFTKGEFNNIADALLKSREYDKEITFKLLDGKEIITFSRWGLIEHGGTKSILVIATDITEKKELERQILHAARLESIGALASGMAHDLNNILAPIVMSASILREEEKDPQRQKLLDTIEQTAKRGANIVKQVLTFAKQMPGKKILVNPKHIVREVINIAQETFPKNITIESSVPANLWVVNADPTQLHQVFLNLSINARDAMPEGGKLSIVAKNVEVDELMAATMPEAKPGPYVMVSVTDTGVGIPDEIMDKIFQPFFTTKPKEIGTGLGLSTALGIVKSHDGFIRVKSKVGKGSTFEVWLPACPEMQEPVQKTPAETYFGNGETILIVDDEVNVLETTKSVLERCGYRVLTASNGVAAIGEIAKNRSLIKAVLCDISMPSMDGPSTMRALRVYEPTVPIIAITGLASPSIGEKLKALNLSALITKPFEKNQLLEILYKVIRGAKFEIKID